MKRTEIIISIYSTSLEKWTSERIKKIIGMLNTIIDINKLYFNIPSDISINDKVMSYDEFINSNCEEIPEYANGIFFSLSDNTLTGSINVNDQFANLDIGVKYDSPSEFEFIREFFLSLSKALGSDLSYVLQTNSKSRISIDCSYGAHDKGIGIKAGLRDVYWLNYYGKAFTNLIGKDKLLGLPVVETKALGDGVYFKLTDNPKDAFDLKDAIKAQIGEEYFVPDDKAGKAHMAKAKDRVGIFGLISHLRHLGKTPENLLVAEKRPPEFE